MMNRPLPAFLASELPPVPPERAAFEIIPVPLEQGISYGGGTAAGPAALLAASQHLELFDGCDEPGRAGIVTGPAVDCRPATAQVLPQVAARVTAARAAGRLPIVLGGEHTVTLGAVQALVASGEPFGVVQFDAHADLRSSYEGNPLSHACVMRRVAELGVPLFQIGVRSLSREEALFRQQRALGHCDAALFLRAGRPPLSLPQDFPRRVYLSFDVDAFDPAVLPGTGTPEPGGLGWYDALRGIAAVLAGRSLIGFDVTELAPIPGTRVSEFTAAKLVYQLMAAARLPPLPA
jgi:agmatinase